MPTKIPKFSELFGTGESVQLHAGDKSLDFFPFLFILFNFFSPGYLQWFTVSTLRLRPYVFKRPRVPYFTKSRARHMRILNTVKGGKSEMRYSEFIFIAAGYKLFGIRIVLCEFFFTHDNIIHKYVYLHCILCSQLKRLIYVPDWIKGRGLIYFHVVKIGRDVAFIRNTRSGVFTGLWIFHGS